jgi:hypothetical protein
MQRMAEGRERRLVESLARRRMGVDGECDVFEARAHFERERKGGRQRVQALRPVDLREVAGRPMQPVRLLYGGSHLCLA